jgi:hypothetical protein
MKFVTLDAETTVRNKGEGAVGDFHASPFCAANTVVCWGEAFGYEGGVSHSVHLPSLAYSRINREPTLLVGCNIGFDLLHFFKQMGSDLTAMLLKNIHIWDIQQAEYLLSGQTHMYPSLNEMAVARGLEPKDDKIAAYWAAGTETEHIPEDELQEYNKHDVELTRTIFLDQWAAMLDDPNLLELMKVKMDDLLSTIWMEWNGMEFDLEAAAAGITYLEDTLASVNETLKAAARSFSAWPAGVEFDAAKTEHVSAVLFGGPVKYETTVILPEVYKTGARAGQHKTRKEEVVAMLPHQPATAKWAQPVKKPGVFKVDDEVLTAITEGPSTVLSLTAAEILKWRELNKDITTYYKGYSALVWPDGRIHPSFNHAATRTGRQSCTKPNLQNVTKQKDD